MRIILTHPLAGAVLVIFIVFVLAWLAKKTVK